MKLLSLITLIAAGVSLLLSLIVHFFFDDRLVFYFTYYITGSGLLLLASIAFALQHLIHTQDKK